MILLSDVHFMRFIRCPKAKGYNIALFIKNQGRMGHSNI